jgi:hypothetical protein
VGIGSAITMKWCSGDVSVDLYVCLFRSEFLNLRSLSAMRDAPLDETSPMPVALRIDARLALRPSLTSGLPTQVLTLSAVNRIGTHLAAHAMLRLLRGYG